MARTINQIKQVILTAKSNEAALAGLTSTSSTALFNLMAYIVSVAIWTLEVIFDKHTLEIDNKINSLIPGTIRWYYQQCLIFQYGDALEWVNSKFGYAVTDTTKMIIKRCAIKEVAGQLRIKVAKETSNIPEALTTPELNDFKSYLNKIKFAGTNLSVISYPAHLIKMRLGIVYDPLVLTANGTTIINNTAVINNAVEDYLKNIIYGGVINRTKLIDTVQQESGIIDVFIVNMYEKESGAPVWNEITTQNFEAVSGYYKLDLLDLNMTADV
ncbi:MAG: nucleotidyltransferase [Bacteroidetes bacterium]|nr:nucleotidyltransferase [Bacteroidota bacterium]